MNCKSVRIEKCQTDGNGEKQWAVRSPSPPMGGVTKACRPTVGLHTIPPLTPLLLLSHPPAPNCRRGKGLQMIIWSAPSSRLLFSSWILPEFTFVSRFYHKRIKYTYLIILGEFISKYEMRCSKGIRPHLWMVSFVLRFSAICIGTMIEVKCKSLWQGCHTNFESWNIKTCRNSDQNLSNSSRDNLKQKQNSQIKIAKGWNDNVFSMIGPSQGGSWN